MSFQGLYLVKPSFYTFGEISFTLVLGASIYVSAPTCM